MQEISLSPSPPLPLNYSPENGQQVPDGKENGEESADPQDKVERVPLDAGDDGGKAALLRLLLVCSCICHPG